MLIMNNANTTLCESDYIRRYSICRKPDAVLIMSSDGENSEAHSLGRYGTFEEAQSALNELAHALISGQEFFEMPLSQSLTRQEPIFDKRTKRKGGS